MEAPYEPISCGLHDQLLAHTTLRRKCDIKYRDEMGQRQQTQALIHDIYTRDGAEYMKLDNGTIIRLDRLIQVEPLR
jgi:Rho-binding antiterminator